MRAIELATRQAALAMKVLMVDNYDSFTYNLVQYLGELGADLEVVRNDVATVDELLERDYDRVVVSPGPCTPNEAGISVEVMRRFPEAGVKTLGVCLGHQSMGQAFGGKVIRHLPDPRQDDRDHARRRGHLRRSAGPAARRALSLAGGARGPARRAGGRPPTAAAS